MDKPRQENYSTADLMKQFDLGRNTLRLYEEMGLLSGIKRSLSGYRSFGKRHFEDLKFIIEAKKVGFTLHEIKDLLSIIRTQKMTCGTTSSKITKRVEEIEKEQQILQNKKEFLNDFLGTCGSKDKTSECDVISAGFTKSACCD